MSESASKVVCLEQHSCYDILPFSFKVIIFDHTLLVKKALAALLQHGVPSAPVWDSANHLFVGMLTGKAWIYLSHRFYSAYFVLLRPFNAN